MRILDRYIGTTVTLHVLIVLLVLLTLYVFSAFVAEMGEVGKGEYTAEKAAVYTVLLTPRQAYQLFPMAALLGTMLGLGALANSSELTVMRAAGVSVRRVTWSVLKVGLLLVVSVTVLGELIAPPLEKFAQVEKAKLVSSQVSVNAKDGLWARDGNSFINMKRLFSDGRAAEVRIYRFGDGSRLRETLFAERGIYRDDAWTLTGVTLNRIDANGVSTRQLERLVWESSLTPAVIDVVAVPPENLAVYDLWDYIRYMRENGLEDRRYDLAMWLRIMTPFATAGMILLAVPFVFGSTRSVGVGQRVMLGALIGIGFYLFNAIFGRVGVVYSIPPEFAASLPTVIVYLAWALLMRRVV